MTSPSFSFLVLVLIVETGMNTWRLRGGRDRCEIDPTPEWLLPTPSVDAIALLGELLRGRERPRRFTLDVAKSPGAIKLS